jgi:hypothetical protein
MITGYRTPFGRILIGRGLSIIKNSGGYGEYPIRVVLKNSGKNYLKSAEISSELQEKLETEFRGNFSLEIIAQSNWDGWLIIANDDEKELWIDYRPDSKIKFWFGVSKYGK